MLHGLILFIHIVVSVILVISVLLQSSKGGGLAGTFGGSGLAGGFFGGRGAAPLLVKTTTVCAVLFMITSISLNIVGPGKASKSALESVGESGGFGSQPAVTNEMPISAEPAAPGGEQKAAGENASGSGESSASDTDK